MLRNHFLRAWFDLLLIRMTLLPKTFFSSKEKIFPCFALVEWACVRKSYSVESLNLAWVIWDECWVLVLGYPIMLMWNTIILFFWADFRICELIFQVMMSCTLGVLFAQTLSLSIFFRLNCNPYCKPTHLFQTEHCNPICFNVFRKRQWRDCPYWHVPPVPMARCLVSMSRQFEWRYGQWLRPCPVVVNGGIAFLAIANGVTSFTPVGMVTSTSITNPPCNLFKNKPYLVNSF